MKSATTILLNGKPVSKELKEKLFREVDFPECMKNMIKSGISTKPKKDHSKMFKKLENDPELKEAFDYIQKTVDGAKP